MNEIEWAAARRANSSKQMHFQCALKSIVTSQSGDWDVPPCAFSNSILLHALLQRIHLVRQLSFGAQLDDDEVEKIQ